MSAETNRQGRAMVMMETEQWWELVQETWGAIMTMMRKWCDVFMQGSLRVHPRRIGYHSLSQCPDLCVSRGADPPLTPLELPMTKLDPERFRRGLGSA